MTDRENEIEAVFDAFDSDGSGELSQKELGKALRSMGHFIKQNEIRKILKQSDEDGDGVLSLEEFTALVVGLDDGQEVDQSECPAGHKMQRRNTNPPAYGGGAASCNGCSNTIVPANGFLHCPECQHDVCMGCIPASTDSDLICNCAKGHKMVNLKSNPPEYKGCQSSCDACTTNIQPVNGFYHCTPCSYDLCNACAHKKGTTAGGGAPPPPPVAVVDPAPTVKKGLKALMIGINYPGTKSELRGCVNDVRTMLKILGHLKVNLRETRILVDDPKYPNADGKPTKANIEAGMKWLTAGAMPGESLIFHYSGHGTSCKGGTETDGADEALVPSDYEEAGIIMDDFIKGTVVDKLPMGANLTAVMDCCHSGSMFDLPYVFTATKENIAAAREGNRVTTGTGGSAIKADVVMISGCQDNQTSADVQSAQGAGGACTNALAEVLGENPDMSITDLLQAMQKSLRVSKFTQIPQLSSSKPITGTSAFKFAH